MLQQVGNKEVKELNLKLKQFNTDISKKEKVLREGNFIFVNNKLKYFEYMGKVLPTLKTIYSDKNIENTFKKITIDMGAVKFAVKGADIMRPGIPKFSSGIEKGEVVLLVDESHEKPICIGISEFSDEDYKTQSTGKAVKNIHYVGDAIWHND